MTAIKCDLRKVNDIEAMFRQIQSAFGAVDVCINNAGLAHNAPLLSGDNEEWREILEVIMSLFVATPSHKEKPKKRNLPIKVVKPIAVSPFVTRQVLSVAHVYNIHTADFTNYLLITTLQ